jgi:hypothetical protein
MQLDYFIFAGGAGKGWVAYCPHQRVGTCSKKITILGNSQLLSNCSDYLILHYNDNMKSVCKKCPQFALHAKGKLYSKKEEIFIENENYFYIDKIKKEYFIKVGGQEEADRKWVITNGQNEVHTMDNIKILNKCETVIIDRNYKNSIKTKGFFYQKLKTISPLMVL